MSLRVTQGMLNSDMLRNLSQSNRSLSTLQDQLSSGKKINKPSDDPVVASRGMMYRSNLKQMEQFQRNASEGKAWMEVTDESLKQVGDIMQRVRELTIQASNETYEEGSLDSVASEIESLKDQLGEIANTTVKGRYIFAGTDTKVRPFREDPATGNEAFLNDNQEALRLEMSRGSHVKINVNGADVFKHDDGDNAGVFEMLDSIVSDLRAGNTPGDHIGNVSEQMDHILSRRASLGSRVNRMELTMTRLENSEYMTNKLMSKEEDADIARVITDLKEEENVHRAALSAGARIIQPTLMDFLR